jgi:hypothetical protein
MQVSKLSSHCIAVFARWFWRKQRAVAWASVFCARLHGVCCVVIWVGVSGKDVPQMWHRLYKERAVSSAMQCIIQVEARVLSSMRLLYCVDSRTLSDAHLSSMLQSVLQ